MSWVLRSEEEGCLSVARSGLLACATRVVGADGKASIGRICISLLMSENLKTQSNKKFRTWTKKSLRVFRVSGFLCSMYICYEHSMYVSHIRIWRWYINTQSKYNDLFFSWFSASWSPLSHSWLDLDKFFSGCYYSSCCWNLVRRDLMILDYESENGILNLSGSDLKPIWQLSRLFHFLSLQ